MSKEFNELIKNKGNPIPNKLLEKPHPKEQTDPIKLINAKGKLNHFYNKSTKEKIKFIYEKDFKLGNYPF